MIKMKKMIVLAAVALLLAFVVAYCIRETDRPQESPSEKTDLSLRSSYRKIIQHGGTSSVRNCQI